MFNMSDVPDIIPAAVLTRADKRAGPRNPRYARRKKMSNSMKKVSGDG